METKKPLHRQLTKKIAIEIVPTDNDFEIEDRIWAINWFDLKVKWMYSLYNRLASKYVMQVGGQLFFKGYHKQTLFGDETLARQTLLIVTYPKITHLLEMIMIKAFQLVGILRIMAVKDFVFGFTKRMDAYTDTNTPMLNTNNAYLVFHYQGGIDLEKISQLVKEHELNLFFHGKKSAQLKQLHQGKADVLVPFFMDGILIVEGGDEEKIRTFALSSEFQEMNTTSYAALFERVN